jgi:predicted nucleic-acid-binding protein
MIGLDTNILVRFMTQDDPQQSALANDVFQTRLTEEEPGFVSVVAVAEMAWVLDRSYRLPDKDVAAAIERVLQTDNLIVENEQAVFTAMIALKEGLGTFADALIGALGAHAGCRCTLTFDRRALRLPEFAQP